MSAEENPPSILVRLVHSVPHFNTTFSRVDPSFDPRSAIYKEVSERNVCKSNNYVVICVQNDFFLRNVN